VKTYPPSIPRAPERWRAFTLIELLFVIALIAILAVATLPAMRSVLDGTNVNGAASMLEAMIATARQTAMSRNLPVEVRFYQDDDGTGAAWRKVGVVIPASSSGLPTDQWIAPGKMLPGNVIMDAAAEFSTILSMATAPSGGATNAPWKSQEPASAPGSVQGKNYVGFRFNADGSSNLPANQAWCLALRNPYAAPAANTPAANFVALVLDPVTGRTLSYQP